jgi:hypothetical protein
MNDRMLEVLALIVGPLRDSSEEEGFRQVDIMCGGCRFSPDPRWFDVGMVTFTVMVPMDLWEMVGRGQCSWGERKRCRHGLIDFSIRRYFLASSN